MADANATTHWSRTRKLAASAIALWLAVTLGAQILAQPLNGIAVLLLGLPLGIVLAVYVSGVVTVALLFWVARRQARIDREHGFDAGDAARP